MKYLPAKAPVPHWCAVKGACVDTLPLLIQVHLPGREGIPPGEGHIANVKAGHHITGWVREAGSMTVVQLCRYHNTPCGMESPLCS